MSKTAADFMAETLANAGVKRIYGVVGDSLNGFTDALRRGKSIEWMHMRHEEGAAFAAGAEAHLTGELAVCAGSCGPGNLHLINGLFDCHRSRVPVLAIAAHIPSTEIGIDYFQATHPEILFKDCSHYVELVSNPGQLAADPDARDARGRRQTRRRRGRDSRRCRAEIDQCGRAQWHRPDAAGDFAGQGRTSRASRRCSMARRGSLCSAAPAVPARMPTWSRSRSVSRRPSCTRCAARNTWNMTTRSMSA